MTGSGFDGTIAGRPDRNADRKQGDPAHADGSDRAGRSSVASRDNGEDDDGDTTTRTTMATKGGSGFGTGAGGTTTKNRTRTPVEVAGAGRGASETTAKRKTRTRTRTRTRTAGDPGAKRGQEAGNGTATERCPYLTTIGEQ